MSNFKLILNFSLTILCILTIEKSIFGQNQDILQVLKAVASDRTSTDFFGHAVAIDGDYAVISALREDHDASNSNQLGNAGSAYVFKKTNGVWSELKKIVPNDRQQGDQFGQSVAISGDYILVGTSLESHDATGTTTSTTSSNGYAQYAGAAYLFSKDEGGADNWGQVKKIVANDRQAADQFGYDVAISGTTAVISTVNEAHDATGTSSSTTSSNGYADRAGSVYVFDKDQGGTNNWGQVKKIVPDDRQAQDQFGRSLTIENDLIAVGADRESHDATGTSSSGLSNGYADDAGSVYLFSRNEGGSNNWGQLKKIVPNDRQSDDFFGSKVDLSGEILVVGAPGEDHDATGTSSSTTSSNGYSAFAGAVYLFGQNEGGTNNWGQVKKIVALDRQLNDRFGENLAIDQDKIVVGVQSEDHNGTGTSSSTSTSDGYLDDAGSAYIFEKDEGGVNNWGQVKKIVTLDRQEDDGFGNTIAISGDIILVGATTEDHNASGTSSSGFTSTSDGYAFSAGSAYFFDNRDKILYVDHSATGGNLNGTSWSNALTDLQDALDMANTDGYEIRIAEGTYKPTSAPTGTAARDFAFHIAGIDVKIGGGWNASTGMQDGENTILSGDIGVSNSITDNCYHVFIANNQTSASIYENLVFIGGEGRGTGSLTYNAESYDRNYGGAMNLIKAHPTIRNCVFSVNYADYGGAISASGSELSLENCIFHDNRGFQRGGAIESNYFNNTMDISVTNCSFIENDSRGGVHGYHTGGGTIQYTNCLFYTDIFRGTHVSLTTTTLKAGTTNNASNEAPGATNSLHQASTSTYIDLSGVSFTDLFVNSSDGDGADNQWMTADDGFLPKTGTAVTQAGTSTGAPIKDVLGETRLEDPTIGAYEFPKTYVDHAATGNNDGSTWEDAYTELQDALDNAVDSEIIRIAEGTYIPQYNLTTTTGSTTDRNNTFHIDNVDIIISGGWDASTNTQTGENTILSADLAGNIANAYHVFVSTNQTRSARFEKLVFTNGNGNGGCIGVTYGGHPVYECAAGAVNLWSSSPSFYDCVFKDNHASFGGAIVCDGTSGPAFENCVFDNNSASVGGAVSTLDDDIDFINCSFISNSATSKGGAISDGTNNTLLVTNCLFYDNTGGTTPNISGNLRAASTNNAADQVTAIGDVTSYVNLSNISASNLFKVSTDGNGADNQWMTSDDGFVPEDRTDVVLAGSSTDAPNDDITSRRRRTKPTIGAYEGTACLIDNFLPTSIDSVYTSFDTSIINGWTNFCSEGGELLLSLEIGTSGAVVNTNEVQLKLGPNTTYGYLGNDGGMINTNDKGYQMIDRRWDVSPTTQPTSGNVSVRYYFTNQEYLDLKDSLLLHGPNQNAANKSTLTASTDISLYKSTTGSPFADPHTVNGIIIANGSTPSTGIWKHSTHGSSDHIAEFKVSSFSGGGGGGGGGGGANPAPLPVELIHFSATPAANHSAHLGWATANEINNSHFIVERSYDGKYFEPIIQILGNGNSNEVINYEYMDHTITRDQNKVYYRLQQFDFDGQSEYSLIEVVNFLDDKSNDISVYPNPFNNVIYLTHSYNGKLDYKRLIIRDITGKSLDYDVVNFRSSVKIELHKLEKGVYFLEVPVNNSISTFKLIKQ